MSLLLVPLSNGSDTQIEQHNGHLATGPADLIKGEINWEDFASRAMPMKRSLDNLTDL